MANADFCSQCGTALPAGSQFCPKCGKPVPVAAPPPAPVIPPPSIQPQAQQATPPQRPVTTTTVPPPVTAEPTHGRSALVWIVPLALLVIGGIIFLLLSGAPYGRDGETKVTEQPATETIGEGESAATATLVEPGDPAPTGTLPPDTATVSPPILREEPPPSVIGEPSTTTPPPGQPREDVLVTTPRPTPVPPPQSTPRPAQTEPVSPPASGEISREEAVNILRGYVTSSDYYGIGARCTSIRGGTYRNVGYTMEVHDSCSNRLLGNWRVDSKTREVFRQQGDGRYLRP